MKAYAMRYQRSKLKAPDYIEKVYYWEWYSGNGYGVAQLYNTEGKAAGIAKRLGNDVVYEVVEIVLPEKEED